MRHVLPVGTLIVACLSALTFGALVMTSPFAGFAGAAAAQDGQRDQLSSIPEITLSNSTGPGQRSALSRLDYMAALEAIQIGLSETADGATFAWKRRRDRLSGTLMPTRSFEDQRGRVCRHVVISLTAAQTARHAEGIACRDGGGIWWLEG